MTALAGSTRRAVAALALLMLASCGGDVEFCSCPGCDTDPHDFTVEFAVTSQDRIGALQFDVAFHGGSGRFLGSGDQVDCTPLVDALVAANHDDECRAKIGLVSLDGIRTPASIMRCGFRAAEAPSPSDFRIDVTDASEASASSEPIEPLPTIVVTSVIAR